MPELKIDSSMRICSGFGFHLGFGSGLRSSHPGTVAKLRLPDHWEGKKKIDKNKSE